MPGTALRTFDSDLHELYSMMDTAWAKDYAREPRLDYTPEFLRWHFDAPRSDPELLVGAYDGDEITGFGSSFPRSVTHRGVPVRATLSTFFTVHAEYRRQRIGWRLVEERLRRNRDRGIQCTFVYLQKGHASQPLYERFGREQNVEVRRIVRYAMRVRMLDLSRLSARSRARWSDAQIEIPAVPEHGATVRALRPSDLGDCLELLNGISESVPLARTWDDERELAWELDHAPFSETVVLEQDGRVRGLLSFFVLERIAKTTEPVGLLDNVCLGDLDRRQSAALITAALSRMRERGCLAVNSMVPPYFDQRPFEKLGFVEVPTVLDLYGVVLDPSLDLSGESSSELDQVYLDQR